MQKIENLIFKKSNLSLIIGLILFLCFLPGVMNVKLNFGIRIWFKQGDVLIEKFDRFQKVFGSENTIFLSVSHQDELWEKEKIAKLLSLQEKLWDLPDVSRVESLFNYSMIKMEEDDFVIEQVLEDPHVNLAEIKKLALSNLDLPGIYISKDGSMVNTIIRLKPSYQGNEDYSHVMKELKDLISPLKDDGFDFAIIGTTPVVEEFRVFGENDLALMIPVLLLLVAISLLVILKSKLGLGATFSVITLSVVSTFGLSGYLGIQLNNISSMVPMVIIAIALADSIHFISSIHMKGKTLLENCRYSFQKNFAGTLLTSVTTTLGFLSLTTSDIVPIRDFGILCAFGSTIAWVYSILVVIPLYLKFGENEKMLEHSMPFPSQAICNLVEFHYKKIVIVFIFITGGFLWLASHNKVNSNPFEYIDPSTQIYKDNELLKENFGGLSAFEILFDSGKVDGVYNPEFLRKMDEFQAWYLDNYPDARMASMINTMKYLNQGFNGAKKENFKLPTDSKIAAEQMLYYSMERPPNLDITNVIDIKNRYLRSTLFWEIQDSDRYIGETRKIQKKIEELGLDGLITGREYLYNGMNDYVVESYFTSIAITIFLITILMMFILKSFTLGLISMLPNLVPLIIGAGTIYLSGKNIDVGIVLVSSICYGIAIDDTIHFLLDYKRKAHTGEKFRDIFKEVLDGTGTALTTTTFIIVLSFSVFWFARFIPNYNFGVFSSLILTIALLTDFLLLPSLLYLLKLKKVADESRDAAR
jgi:predicted RND superfamily exporter protein